MLLLLTGSALALAQGPPPPTVNSKDDQLLAALFNTPIEAVSKRRQSPLESPQAVEVLTADQIRASGVFRLIDLLKLMASVEVYEQGRDFTRLSIRGTVINAGMKNVQLLVDGVPLFNTQSNLGTSFDSLPIPVDAIERVEVVRGPSSSLYGANAQAGVIAITTRKAQDGTSGSLRAGAAGQGTFNSQGFFSYGTERFTVAAGFGGHSQPDSGISERVLGGSRWVDTQDQNHGSQAFLRPEMVLEDGRIWALVSRSHQMVGPTIQESPAGIPSFLFGYTRSITEAEQLGWSQAWSPSLHTELKLNRSRQIPTAIPVLEAVPGSPSSTSLVTLLKGVDPMLNGDYDFAVTTTEQATFQANWNPSTTLHAVFGLDTTRLKSKKALIVGFQTDLEHSATGGFLSVDWTLGPVTYSIGARLENETLGGSRVSPRATLVYVLPDGSVLRSGYFTSTRSPLVAETSQDIRVPGRPSPLGNPGLQPETFDNVEVGYRKQGAAWSLDLTAFQMLVRKAITDQPNGLLVGGFQQTQFQNSGATQTNQGVELTLKGEIRPGWRLGFNATRLNFRDESGRQAYFRPAFTANLWTRYHFQRFQAYAALQRIGSYRLTNTANLAGPSEAVAGRLQAHFNLVCEYGAGFNVSVYGINALRTWDATLAGSVNNSHLIRFSRREIGLQASYQF